MAKKKYDLITDLYAEAIKEVTDSPGNWMSFLRSACRNFRLPFDEQILIYAQRPEASAVLPMKVWNEKFGRWVKRDSKGIAVFDKDSPKLRLKYYYDVSDTQEGRFRRLLRPVPLWEVPEEYQPDVRETLVNAFGVDDTVTGFAETILEAAKIAAEDNITDYLSDLLAGRKGSYLEEVDEYNVEVETRQLLAASTAYMVMVRCGVDTDLYLDTEDFRSITDFNTPEMINLFGVAASDVAEMALSEISDTVNKLRKAERRKNRTFAGRETGRYNESENRGQITERGVTHESDHIQQTGRLSSSGSDRAGRTGSTPWEVRFPASEISEGTPIRDLSESADDRKTEQPSERSAEGGTEEVGSSDRTDESSMGRDGRTESERPDGVGTADEQHPAGGGRDRNERTDLQLTGQEPQPEEERQEPVAEPQPTVTEQQTFLEEKAGEESPAFSMPQEIIDHALQSGPPFEHGKNRIYSYFLQGHSNKERAEFLKQEYGMGGSLSDYLGERFYQNRNAKGYTIQWKNYETTLKWTAVAKRIEELIAVGRYMTEKELEYIPEYEKGVLARGIYNFFYHQPETFLRPYPYGSDYHRAIEQIRPQLDDPNRVKEILSMMEEVLAGTADYDQRYPSMQQAYKDLTDYQDGAFSLFTPIPAERENMQAPLEPVPAQSREEVLAGRLNAFYQSYDWYEYQDTIDPGETQENVLRQLREQLSNPQSVQEIYSYLLSVREGMDTEDENYSEVSELIAGIADLPAMNPPYDLQVDTIVTIGTKEYSIDFISDETVVLRDQMYPLFTEEMPREVFDRRVRENPVNDHLKSERKSLEEPAEKDREESAPTQEIAQEQEDGFAGIKPEDNPFEKEPEEVLEDLTPTWTQKKSAGRVKRFDLHPEIPQESRSQYRITDEHLGEGTAKEKFRANLMAIQLLKKCEEENRFATPKEQEILAGYVGWGGLSGAFDETKSSWSTEYLELKTVLTEEEYAAARQSTLTAFYTPPVVISAMYQALENMGLKSGNILEPSCGTGNFIGRKPESLSDCKVYGVEIDSISARIAQQLYQKSTIAAQGFENAELPDSFFDVVIGNVPFGSYKVLDRNYDKYNFLIHDYFIAKSIDKTRPKGVLALITSNGISGGTMDKRDDRVRRYIAQRCDLLGAIRLPNNAFLANAGTEINTDILFFQKRETPRDLNVDLPDWVEVERLYENDHVNEQGESRHRVVSINPYFQQHPEMVLGEQEIVSGPYGPQLICKPYPDRDLKNLLAQAVENLEAEITDYEVEELVEEEDHSIPADPFVANFSYTVYDGKIYYRENSRMKPVELSVTAQNRVKGMIAIRDCTRELIAYQTEGYPDEEIEGQQKKLNHLYDLFQRKYGLLNSRANSMAFSDDSSYPLLCSLEIVAEDGTLERKADMFTKRTIKPHETVTKVDTASEALSLSLSEKACVDMDYLCSLTGKSAGEVEEELKGVIFRLPESEGMEQPRFVSEDEYLSGNVRKKLREAKQAAEISEMYRSNVEALEKVQPKDLTASEISVRLGATWIPESDIADFMFELLQTPNYSQWKIKVHFSRHTGEWNIEGKSMDRGNPRVINTYGTNRVNAYKIIEDTLNLRDTRVFDYMEDEAGKRKPILNRKETAIAQGKQDLIKQAFQEWIWKDPERRQRLTEDYNERFNAIRPREYDGSHLHFYGMNPEITLRKHQKDGVARIIYGGNTLLAYVVGAGKTYTMVAAAMECKRLGLCSKSMVVVPNHIIEQFAAEWLQLYPAANILVATKKDFEKKNRKKFCGRIATSDIDAVLIGHSQFEKIPLSIERQERMLQMEIDEIIEGIAEAKKIQGSRFTVKQMERTKKSLETRLKRLHDQSRKDDMITFEELGVDRLFVDEADSYKNLYITTKMRNVGGIAQTEAQKSSDMYMKCRYLDEITGGKGVIFSTGTPVSNSMVVRP